MRMSQAEREYFLTVATAGTRYLEYGSGGSTKLAAQLSNLRHLVSVESDPAYVAEHVRDDAAVTAAEGAGRLRFLIIDIGATGEWGHPRDESKKYLWPNYALSPYLAGERPDTILIDGRFRVACGLVAALEAPAARVLVHDYSDRRQYHLLEEFFTVVHRVDTLVELARKQIFDATRAQALLKKYLYAPADAPQTLTLRARSRARGLRQRLLHR